MNTDLSRTRELIIVELLANSLKHAFPELKTGEIFIGLRQEQGANSSSP